jgi:hypothetical protein
MKTDELLCNYIWLCLEEYRLSPRYRTAKRLRRALEVRHENG